MKNIRCQLFKGIKDEELKQLYNCLRARQAEFKGGEELYSFGSGKTVLGVITQGKVVVKKIDRNGNVNILDHIQKNGVISNAFAFSQTDGNFVSAYAVENTKVVFFDYSNVFKRCQKACEYHSQFVENLFDIVIEKSKTLSQRVEILSNKTIREKILSYLSFAVKNTGSTEITLPMSLTSFAEFLSVDRSAMMRELKKLSVGGIIKTDKRIITVLKREYI
ncbi:MAG: Crp/Fnr family transcriptional regulator [Clostridia bacterium]|jgi:CRP-like cAMP-binding protein|nr:Crp/Fnr family transcriptional regulator [Clostridia bacterium]